ncbi:hypothetical protein [Desulfosediminicola ganghwensis]|uniref:hypothetical protein n=1 Tax=Desulfosediminicola ganghwensis TaxID=2569540 RepID=UPI0010AD563D|nr:hypothetical protein [Desulfosediminicola ganghwensis]
MKLSYILIAALVLSFSGCTLGVGPFTSSKLPDEWSATNGVLVIATDATNRTSDRFAYYYSFVSADRPDFKINLRLLETRKTAVIADMIPGQYTLTGVKVVSEPTSQIKTFVAPDIRQMKHPVSFTIEPGAITILDYGVSAAQVYPNGFRFEDLMQNMQLKKLSAVDRSVVLQDLSLRGNLSAWKVVESEPTGHLPEVAFSNSSKAFIRTYIRRYDD